MLYILHFSEPLGDTTNPKGSALHYTGFCRDGRVLDRLLEHQHGLGSKITAAAARRGISMVIGATLPGGREDERMLKKSTKNAPRFCTICRERKLAEKMGL